MPIIFRDKFNKMLKQTTRLDGLMITRPTELYH